MLFLTYWFVVFVAAFFPLYWFLPFRRLRLSILVVGCAVFHTHFAGPAGVLPIIALGALVYLIGLTRNRYACGLGIALSAGSLVYYKYTKFLCQSLLDLGWLPATSQPTLGPQLLAIVPPLAISFFTFEFIHYLVDVAKGSPPIRRLRDFALFAVFWPSIVAGPVKRYQHFLVALNAGVRGVGARDVAFGLLRVGVGLGKKLAADTLTAWLTFQGPTFETLDPVWRWFFVLCLALRILLDFSGYSDMAIGFARMHGIALPENFTWPYLASSLTTFWHRWHCSLSLWIRDYIYIALGGGRRGLALKVFNGLLAFAICGLWHGAGWNFLVWGLYHGVGLAIAGNYRTLLGRVGEEVGQRLTNNPVAGWALTMLYVSVGWLFFFYPLPVAYKMLTLLFGVAEYV